MINYSNIILFLLCVLFFTMFWCEKCSHKPREIILNKKQIDFIKINLVKNTTKDLTLKFKKTDSLYQINESKMKDSIKKINGRNTLLEDSIYKYQSNLIKPDLKSSFWFVRVDGIPSTEFSTIIKLPISQFDIIEAENIISQRYKLQRVNIEFFNPITENCYLNYYQKYLKNKIKTYKP